MLKAGIMFFVGDGGDTSRGASSGDASSSPAVGAASGPAPPLNVVSDNADAGDPDMEALLLSLSGDSSGDGDGATATEMVEIGGFVGALLAAEATSAGLASTLAVSAPAVTTTSPVVVVTPTPTVSTPSTAPADQVFVFPPPGTVLSPAVPAAASTPVVMLPPVTASRVTVTTAVTTTSAATPAAVAVPVPPTTSGVGTVPISALQQPPGLDLLIAGLPTPGADPAATRAMRLNYAWNLVRGDEGDELLTALSAGTEALDLFLARLAPRIEQQVMVSE